MEPKRCVITGLGIVSPLGIGEEKFWNGLKSGKSGIRRVTRFEIDDYTSQVAGEVPDFEITDYMEKKEARRTDLVQQYSIGSADLALKDAELDLEKEDTDRIGCIYASGIGGIITFEDQIRTLITKGPRRVSPFFIPMMIPDMTSGMIALKYNLKGPNYATVSACASSSNSIAASFHTIARGDAEVVVSGGSEAAISPASFAGFCSAKALSTRNDEPERASRPFDKDRDGFVIAEGSCTVVLESLEHAQKRGAKIYAEVIGAGLSCDAHHITAPSPGGEGAARAMKAAVRSAELQPQDVNYINTHGTSTGLGDIAETLAIKSVFGERAYEIPANSTKSMVGHLLGGAGAIEVAAVCLQMKNNYLHPTVNLDNPDPECDLDYVANEGRDYNIDIAVSNSFGFGGHNVSLVLKRFE